MDIFYFEFHEKFGESIDFDSIIEKLLKFKFNIKYCNIKYSMWAIVQNLKISIREILKNKS